MAARAPKMGASECDDGDVEPRPEKGLAKVPMFGTWEGGEVVQYTKYIDNSKKTKNLQSGFEPQMNGDVGRGPTVASREGQERPSSVAQAPAHPKANLQPRTTARQGNQGASIPHYGQWNTDPSQAEGYTVAFSRAREERQTPQNDTPRNYGKEPWIRDLFVNCGQHRPPIHEDAYGGGIRTRYDQIGSGAKIPLENASQVNVASTPRNLMPTMSTIYQPEQKPTKQASIERLPSQISCHSILVVNRCELC
ncbi:uncharacterized protein LOC141596450 [Silene latifolia]|uniref:uncharacterized protein LOC141596450 n=1 Tax=Silene latifolia TaxID=37657 RepID=UPI003D7882AA